MTDVALIGDASLATAYSRINRVWLEGLRAAGYRTDGEGAIDVLIHHDYSQHFATCDAGAARHRVAVRTWDFGPFPRAWAQRIGRDFDRLWVHSAWVREKAIEGGVDRELVAVVPHGIDPVVFTPSGRAADVGATFTFLFVGATVARKGVDILLRAYAQAFAADEPVCLILKGHSGDVFYRGQQMTDVIAEFQRDPRNPCLRHMDAYISEEDLAGLYRSADVGVFPYRAEGFAIPILEAMACGLPCIVPRFGACLDYCTDDNAFFVQPRRVRLPVRQEMVYNTFGFREQVDAVDFCEVPVVDLAAALRAAFEAGPEALRAHGEAAARTVRQDWTRQSAMALMLQRLRETECLPARSS